MRSRKPSPVCQIISTEVCQIISQATLYRWVEHLHLAKWAESLLSLGFLVIGPAGLVVCYLSAQILVGIACNVFGVDKRKETLAKPTEIELVHCCGFERLWRNYCLVFHVR